LNINYESNGKVLLTRPNVAWGYINWYKTGKKFLKESTMFLVVEASDSDSEDGTVTASTTHFVLLF